MALNYYFDKIDDYENVVWIKTGEKNEDGTDEATMNPVTQALIFATLTVGLGEITDKNVAEFAARFRVIEKIDGAYVHKKGEPHYITDEEFIAHIGLRTNVGNETRASWSSRNFGAKPQSKTSQLAYEFERNRKKVTA